MIIGFFKKRFHGFLDSQIRESDWRIPKIQRSDSWIRGCGFASFYPPRLPSPASPALPLPSTLQAPFPLHLPFLCLPSSLPFPSLAPTFSRPFATPFPSRVLFLLTFLLSTRSYSVFLASFTSLLTSRHHLAIHQLRFSALDAFQSVLALLPPPFLARRERACGWRRWWGL